MKWIIGSIGALLAAVIYAFVRPSLADLYGFASGPYFMIGLSVLGALMLGAAMVFRRT